MLLILSAVKNIKYADMLENLTWLFLNGTEARDKFMAFMTGKQTASETKEMMSNLHEYCGQDTMVMVRLLVCFLNNYYLIFFLYSSPHAAMAFNTGDKVAPNLVMLYSTRGGTSG